MRRHVRAIGAGASVGGKRTDEVVDVEAEVGDL